MKRTNFAIITGAGRGLGKALAEECASLGKNLILTALPGEDIDMFASELAAKYNTETCFFETDLTETGAVESFAGWAAKNYQIDMLVNNAGVGGTKAFLDASPDYIDRIVFLNMRALVLLTRLLLPELKKQPRAYILNIASMASFGPMPFKTVYPASKAFVYSFSRGLGAELKGSGITVSVAHPGGMKTNPDVARRIENHGKLIQATTLPVEKVARICIRQLLKGDELIIPGAMNKVSWLMMKIVPVWLRLIIMRRSLQHEISAEGRCLNTQPVCHESFG